MKESNLVSVIVPIFKVEPYLNRCVDSLLVQTHDNLEIILVDDGSPDRCGDICDEYAKKDDRIKVVHKKNGGLSDARNAGVRVAVGKYIAFVDSDDYVTSDYIQYLLELLENNQADISVCNYYIVQAADTVMPEDEMNNEITVMSGTEASKKLFGDETVKATVAWNKLYKADIVKKFPFPKGRVHEDEATTYLFLYESERVVFGNRCCYAYYQNPFGIMGSVGNQFKGDAVWAWHEQLRFYHAKEEQELTSMAYNRLCGYLLMHHFQDSESATFYLKKLILRRDMWRYMSFMTRGGYLMALYCPLCYKICYKIYCKIKQRWMKRGSDE